MYVIQRVKGDATHYAAAVEPAGNVSAWVKDRAGAVAVDDATALRVEDYYAAKVAAGLPVGRVTAEDVAPVAPPVTRPAPDDAE